jgi:hypothetical protein
MKTTILLLSIILCATPILAQKAGRKYPWVKIETLDKATSDTVRLKAYVFDIYKCPPCPEGAQCKPCMENHLTVVEDRPVDPMKVPLNGRLFIFTEQEVSLETGKRYAFTVKFRNRKVSSSGNVTLISFKPL